MNIRIAKLAFHAKESPIRTRDEVFNLVFSQSWSPAEGIVRLPEHPLIEDSLKAHGGYRYFLTFTDDLSRYGYIYLMKHKSETFEKFKEFQSEVENHRNKKIKFLRSDRGGEYLS